VHLYVVERNNVGCGCVFYCVNDKQKEIVSLSLCVEDRHRERERESERKRDRDGGMEKERGKERERVCVGEKAIKCREI
jgi:hypothetical protein